MITKHINNAQEHAGALTKAYTDHSQKAREVLRKTSLRYPPPSVTWCVYLTAPLSLNLSKP